MGRAASKAHSFKRHRVRGAQKTHEPAKLRALHRTGCKATHRPRARPRRTWLWGVCGCVGAKKGKRRNAKEEPTVARPFPQNMEFDERACEQPLSRCFFFLRSEKRR